jgi:hypothetical protein
MMSRFASYSIVRLRGRGVGKRSKCDHDRTPEAVPGPCVEDGRAISKIGMTAAVDKIPEVVVWSRREVSNSL